MNDKKLTKIELTIGENKVSWETPYDDCSIEDLLQAFAGLLFTHTFAARSIIKGMKNYIEEHED